MKRGMFLFVFALMHAAVSSALAYRSWKVFEHRYGSNTAVSVTDRAIQIGADVLLSPTLPIATQVPGWFGLPRVVQVAGLILNSLLWALAAWWLIPKQWRASGAQQGAPGDAKKRRA